MSAWVLVSLIVCFSLLLVLSALFSACETVMLSLSAPQVQHLCETKPTLGKRLATLLSVPERWLTTILVGNTFVNAAIAAVGLAIVTGSGLVADGWQEVVSILLVTLLVLLFGEISPKQIAIHHTEQLVPIMVRLLTISMPLLAPLTWCFQCGLRPFRRRQSERERRSVSDEELMSVVSLGEERGTLDLEEGAMVRGILRLSELHASDVMTPRVDMIGLDSHDSPLLHEVQLRNSPYVWMPLWEDSPDRFIDFIDVSKYLLDPQHNLEAARCHCTTCVPENIGLDDLLILLYRQKLPTVIVSDEYGGTAGIVSRGDILELLSLETEDDLQMDAPDIRVVDENTWEIAGDASLEQINFQLGTHLDADDSDRMSGWVMLHAGRIPKAGDTIVQDGYSATVQKMRQHKLLSVILKDLNPASREIDHPLSMATVSTTETETR